MNSLILKGFISVCWRVLLCLLLGLKIVHAEQGIVLSPDNINNLGIALGKVLPVKDVPWLVAPAQVTIPSSREYIVSSTQTGLITRLIATVNDTVKKGQLIAQIDSPALLELQGQFLKANSLLQLATAMYERDKKLLQEGVIASRREQETFSQYNAALLDVNQSKQLLGMAGMNAIEIARLSKTQRLNGQLNVYAPIDGMVIERLSVAGTRVDNLTPLYRIANLDELWLDINIPQEHITEIKMGDHVAIENIGGISESHSSADNNAVISQIGVNVNPDNQTILVRAKVKNSKTLQKVAAVRAGEKITVKIIRASGLMAFSVPNAAIAQHEGKSVIFIRTTVGFTVCPVTVMAIQAANTVVTATTLNANNEIAVSGAAALKANWLGLGSDE